MHLYAKFDQNISCGSSVMSLYSLTEDGQTDIVIIIIFVYIPYRGIMLNTYDKFTLFQYFGQRPFSRKNMHFSINYIVSVPPF